MEALTVSDVNVSLTQSFREPSHLGRQAIRRAKKIPSTKTQTTAAQYLRL